MKSASGLPETSPFPFQQRTKHFTNGTAAPRNGVHEMNVIHPTADDFRSAKSVDEYDALYEAAMEHFAYSFDSNHAYEAAGGDGSAADTVDAWLQHKGLDGLRTRLLSAEYA